MSSIHSYHNTRPVVALVDCNSFYASCEKVFRPDLKDKPVVVLSNNDGCIIARSKEAKALNIDMGQPFFKVRPQLHKHKVSYFSSNYALYGDISRRVMQSLSLFTPNMEVYSIDEAFLDLTGIIQNGDTKAIEEYGKDIKQFVQQSTGIPVSVGIAETKVLSKIANQYAKKVETCYGVFCLPFGNERDAILEKVDTQDIWGIGRKLSLRLKRNGIDNAREFRDADPVKVRYHPLKMGIVGARMVWELRGCPCLDYELVVPNKKEVACTRSFGKPITNLKEMKESIATYTARVAEKARKQKSVPCAITVFLLTNPFKPNDPQYYNSRLIKLPVPTATTQELVYYATEAISQIFKNGYRYKKSGVILSELIPETEVQTNMFDERDRSRDFKLMKVMDTVNGLMGSETIQLAGCGVKPGWHLKADYMSPRYTTRMEEVLHVR